MATALISQNATDISSQPINIVRGTHGQLVAFLVLNIWPSHLGLPLLLAVVLLSRKIQRHITFINLCVAFIIIGISSSLLLYAGKIEGPEPPKMLCLMQASLLYGMPALSSTSALILVLQMFFVIRSHYHGQEYLDRNHAIRLWAMLISPYVSFLFWIVTTAVIGASHPERLSRNRRFFYCSVDFLPLTNTLTIFSAVVLFATLVFEAWTVVILVKQWNVQKGSTMRRSLELSLPIRILAFGFYITIALSLSLLSIKTPQSPVPDLAIASAATVVTLIFGTQTDILRALRFWRNSPPEVKSYGVGTGSVDLLQGERSASEQTESYQWKSHGTAL